MKQYRVIVTHKAPFCEPVEMPYGPAQPSKFSALASLVTALDLHVDDDDEWSAVQSIRIEVSDV